MLDVLSVLRRKMERIRLFWAEEEDDEDRQS